MGGAPRVLIVEPDAATRALLVTVLRDAGYAAVGAPDGPAGLAHIEREPSDLVLVNARLPVMGFDAFAAHYRSGPGPHAPLIVLSTGVELPLASEAAAVVPMPFDLEELLTVVRCHAPLPAEGVMQRSSPRAPGGGGKNEARRQRHLQRLSQAVAAVRQDVAANRAASRRLLAAGRPLRPDELVQWRALGWEAERLRHELALLYTEFERLRCARPGSQ